MGRLEKVRKAPPQSLQKECSPTNSLTPDLWSQALWENRFLLLAHAVRGP